MQSAADLITAVVAELAARMEHGEHDLDGGLAALVHVDGDAAPVVADGDRIVGVDRHIDLTAIARQRLINRVVDHLINQMMKSALRRRTYIHARTHANRFQALKYLNLIGGVFALDRADLRILYIAMYLYLGLGILIVFFVVVVGNMRRNLLLFLVVIEVLFIVVQSYRLFLQYRQ